MLGRLPSSKARLLATSSLCLGALLLSACSGMGTSNQDRSALRSPAPSLAYDHIEYENTSSMDVADNRLFARMPRVQAALAEAGGKMHTTSSMLPYIVIEADEVNNWRYANVAAPKDTRDYYAPPMRLPINKSVPVGTYIVVRPVTKIWPADRTSINRNGMPEAYLFQVLASATADDNSGNLLQLRTGVTAAKKTDWVVPIEYMDQSQAGMSSVMEETDAIIIAFAPNTYLGSSGNVAVIRGGVDHGFSKGDMVTIIPGRLDGDDGRANRDARDLAPEGIATAEVLQATRGYSLIEIRQSAQQITEGDIVVPRQHGGKSN